MAKRTGVILITQKRKRPLQEVCRALKKYAGVKVCPILRAGAAGYGIQLRVEDSAKFVKVFKPRVKTEKALKDLELAERRLRRKRKHYRSAARRAIQVLEGSLK